MKRRRSSNGDAGPAAERPSKSARKRESHALQALGERLLEAPPALVDELDLPEALRDAIGLARRIRERGALRRQRQLIGKLMRQVDPAPIEAALARADRSHRDAVRLDHAAEAWRERLLEGGDADVATFVDEHPHVDVQRLRRLVRAAGSDREAVRERRELFRLIRATLNAGTD